MEFEQTKEFLRSNHRGVVTTFQRNGAAQSSIVVCGAYQDYMALVSVRGRSAKVRNLRRDPRLSACIYAGERGEEYVALYGKAELEVGEGVWPQVRRIVERYQQPDTIEEYMGELMAESFAIITLAPERALFGP